MQWLVLILGYDQWVGQGVRLGWIAVVAGWLLFTSAPGRAAILIVARRALIPRLTPGRYSRHGWLALRLLFLDRLSAAFHLQVLAGTPWSPRYARMNGVKVGENARLATLPSPTSLLSIGDGATLEADVDARSWWVEGDEIVVGQIRVGRGARIGTRCVLLPGADVGAGAEVEPGSVVTSSVPADERWSGSPARRVGVAGETWPLGLPSNEERPVPAKALFGLGLLVLALIPAVASVPELIVLSAMGQLGSVAGVAHALLIEAPMFALLYLLSYAVTVAVAVRSVSWLIRPGLHSDRGGASFAMWFTEAVLAGARGVLFPLYTSVYTRTWLKMLGIRVGRRTEVSTAVGLNRLTRIGATSFLADDVVLAGSRSWHGWIEIAPIQIGDRAFLGNGAVLRPGTRLGDDCLVGILSTPPEVGPDGTSWFGLPSLELPRRPEAADPSRTVDPPKRLVVARGAFELIRIVLPASISVILGSLAFYALAEVGDQFGGLLMAAIAPVVVAAASLCAVALTVASKWIVIGRYKAGDHPFWSFFVWRDELVNTLQEQLAGAWLLERALASPILSVYFRAMGARIGREAWIECLNVTEFDLVTVEDGVCVNRGACIDTHLVHDRILRLGPATLARNSTLGPESAVLPNTALGAGCSVGGRSVVMRGESLPPFSRWHGIPVQPQ